MASLYIAEYGKLALGLNGETVLAPIDPPIAEQKITIAGTSAASAAFNTQTRFIRMHTDAICHILIGKTPTAVATKARMVAGQTEVRGVNGGDKIAVIEGT